MLYPVGRQVYLQENVMGYTVELDGGSGTPVGGTTTTGTAFGSNPSGFVFQDREADGGRRYGRSGISYHRMRGSVEGFTAGQRVKVWFTTAGGKSSDPFTFTASSLGHGNRVLVLAAEDYRPAPR